MNWQDRVSEMYDYEAETPGVKPEEGRKESTDDKRAKKRLADMIAKHDRQRAKHGVKNWFGKGVFTKETGKKNWKIDSPEKEEQITDRQARRDRANDPNRPRTTGPKATHPGSAREVRGVQPEGGTYPRRGFDHTRRKGGRTRTDDETQINWQDKIYESLTETRSAENRRKVRLRKTSAEQNKRKAAGKSVGAYGAGTRARIAKALAKKASKPDAWHAKRHHEGEADRLIAHGKRYATNQKAKNKDNKSRADLVNKVLKRDETRANLAKLTIRGK